MKWIHIHFWTGQNCEIYYCKRQAICIIGYDICSHIEEMAEAIILLCTIWQWMTSICLQPFCSISRLWWKRMKYLIDPENTIDMPRYSITIGAIYPYFTKKNKKKTFSNFQKQTTNNCILYSHLSYNVIWNSLFTDIGILLVTISVTKQNQTKHRRIFSLRNWGSRGSGIPRLYLYFT